MDKIPITKTAEEKIREEAERQGVSQNLAVAIAKCESGLDQGAKNPNSSASGIFQFIRGTFEGTRIAMGLPKEVDVFDESINIKMGIWLLKREGTRPWVSSAHCWKPRIDSSSNVLVPNSFSLDGTFYTKSGHFPMTTSLP